MKERPILFSAPMVRALLSGAKTQTRRTVVGAPAGTMEIALSLLAHDGDLWDFRLHLDNPKAIRCPYGKPSDRLWVREEHYRFGHWEAVTGAKRRTRTGRQRWRFVADSPEIRYEAPAEFRKGRHHRDPATPAWHRRLARFMPRAASRITLEITEVRVQRLGEISEDDARTEGVEPGGAGDADLGGTARGAFHRLWDSINGKRAPWSSNPWVWCLTFRRLP